MNDIELLNLTDALVITTVASVERPSKLTALDRDEAEARLVHSMHRRLGDMAVAGVVSGHMDGLNEAATMLEQSQIHQAHRHVILACAKVIRRHVRRLAGQEEPLVLVP